jgi:hypothetical protein
MFLIQQLHVEAVLPPTRRSHETITFTDRPSCLNTLFQAVIASGRRSLFFRLLRTCPLDRLVSTALQASSYCHFDSGDMTNRSFILAFLLYQCTAKDRPWLFEDEAETVLGFNIARTMPGHALRALFRENAAFNESHRCVAAWVRQYTGVHDATTTRQTDELLALFRRENLSLHGKKPLNAHQRSVLGYIETLRAGHRRYMEQQRRLNKKRLRETEAETAREQGEEPAAKRAKMEEKKEPEAEEADPMVIVLDD